MAVKVTGQFEPAGSFSIVDGKDVSGNITGSNVSASGYISASSFAGDGSGITGLSSAAISSYNSSGDNRVVTSVNSSTVQGEANLTFASSGLNVNGNVTASGHISSSGTIIAQDILAGGVFEVGLRTKGLKDLPTGTIVTWEDGNCVPCYKSEDQFVMGVTREGKDEPIVLGAEPILVTGNIEEGEYIVTSDVIGHGKSVKIGYLFKKNLFGKVIGQALESSEGDTSLIKCMIRKM